MTRDEFMELVYETFDGEPDNVLANGIIQAADDYAESMLPEPCVDAISRQAAIDAVNNAFDRETLLTGFVRSIAVRAIRDMPSAQPEQKIYRSMSEEEFEAWLYNHGICHPDIHESIACDIVPSLIDDAINELPPAQPEEAIPVSWIEAKIKRFMTMDNAFGGLTANIMLVMLNEWKREQEGETE